jgi:hypothetical protein
MRPTDTTIKGFERVSNVVWRRTCGSTAIHTSRISGIVPSSYTLLNSILLGDVLTMFESKGWELVSAQTAFHDPVFSNVQSNVPAGESLIWAMAKESGKFEGKLRYPGESDEYEEDVEAFRGEQSVHDDEARSNPHQAQSDVK